MIIRSKGFLGIFSTANQPDNVLVARLRLLGRRPARARAAGKRLACHSRRQEILFPSSMAAGWSESAKIPSINIYNIANQAGYA
ncbi:MAG: hypothetical protein ACTXOO_01680 [Sodalis sp. (in: enterobacteria)]